MRLRPLVIVTGLLLIVTTGIGLWQRGAHEVTAPAVLGSEAWPAPQPAVDDWPWWRGSLGNGISQGNPPLRWSRTPTTSEINHDNIVWRTPLPGRGNSSPIVWGNRVLLTTADETSASLSLISFDRHTGEQQWNCELQRGDFPKIHAKNSHASATPACDGRHIYVPFVAADTLWMAAVTFDGNLAWRTNAGPYRSDEGFAASPALHESLVIVAADSRGPTLDRLTGSAFLAGLDRRTGDVVWRVKRPGLNSYGTPIIGKVAGRSQLLLSGGRYVASYDPLTGSPLWQHHWAIERTAGSPAFDNERVFASATIWNSGVVCLRGDGADDASAPRLQWKQEKSAADVPSPIVLGERLYVLTDGGILTCSATVNGHVQWKKRFHGDFSASPVATADRLYLANEEGVTFVVDGTSGNVLSENALLESIFATPAIGGDELLIRTDAALYSIRNARGSRGTLTQTSSETLRTSQNAAN